MPVTNEQGSRLSFLGLALMDKAAPVALFDKFALATLGSRTVHLVQLTPVDVKVIARAKR